MRRPSFTPHDRGCYRWLVQQSILVLLAIVASIGLAKAVEPSSAPDSPATESANAQPKAASRRPLWANTRLVGSPEPPLPYTVEKTFAKLALRSPIYVIAEPGTNKLWIILQGGDAEHPSRVLRIDDDSAVAEAQSIFELPKRLLYAVTFDPEFTSNRHVYLFSNGPTGDDKRMDRVARYTVEPGPRGQIEPKSQETIIEWASAGHDGGDLAFGPDRMLYITTGDGSSDSDTLDSGQTLDDLLGSVLRIDPARRDGPRPYAVPADNPFVDVSGARPEIWAYGLRNPWRMSIDQPSGQVWVGNNGQDLWETAHLIRRGDNCGWSVYEGSHPFYLERKRGPTPPVLPTIEHPHSEFRSLTGGVVYRGSVRADLEGAYIYGDYSSGRIWGMKHDGQKVVWHRELADTSLQIAGFGVDQRGDLLVVDHGGGIYCLVPAPADKPAAPFPRLLSESGLFAAVAEHGAAPGLVGYSVNVPGWADGAAAERFIALPGDARIDHKASGSWGFPDGTALVQTLGFPRDANPAVPPQRVETRVLLRQQGEWAGYSYRWNAEGTDASLVDRPGVDAVLAINDSAGGTRQQAWRFPSRDECMACHSRAATYVLGVGAAQLNRSHGDGGANQLQSLADADLFEHSPSKPAAADRLVDPWDESGDLEARVRSYLHVNCSVCHVAAGGGNAKMELATATAREKMSLIGARPQHDTFGIANAMLVAPGEPDRSVIVRRLGERGRGQMPPLVSRRVDERAVALVRRWIASLKPNKPFVRAWQMEDLTASLPSSSEGRTSAAGKTAFRETGCIECHRFGSEGGTVGPDLTDIAKRQKPGEVLESILDPSKVIPDQYATYAIELTDGRVVSGRIEREDAGELVLRLTATPDQPLVLTKDQIADRQRLKTSNMPAGIVNVLQKEEVLDLLAYLLGAAPTAEEK